MFSGCFGPFSDRFRSFSLRSLAFLTSFLSRRPFRRCCRGCLVWQTIWSRRIQCEEFAQSQATWAWYAVRWKCEKAERGKTVRAKNLQARWRGLFTKGLPNLDECTPELFQWESNDFSAHELKKLTIVFNIILGECLFTFLENVVPLFSKVPVNLKAHKTKTFDKSSQEEGQEGRPRGAKRS